MTPSGPRSRKTDLGMTTTTAWSKTDWPREPDAYAPCRHAAAKG